MPGLLAAVLADIGVELLELLASIIFPWEWDEIDDQWHDLMDAFEAIGELIEFVGRALDLVESASDPGDQVRAVASALNLLWTLAGVPFVPVELGRNTVDHVLNMIARGQLETGKRGPDRSFVMLADGERAVQRESGRSAEGTMIVSREYAVPADQTLPFVDALMAGMNGIRRGGDASIMVANIRFTRNTRATIGMQQFAPLTGHIEVYTAAGLDGTRATEAMVDAVAARFSAAPHWGQVHGAALAMNAYGSRRSWAAAMARLDPDGSGTSRRDFVAARRLY